MDHVDKIIQQWNQERPDLDVEPMEIIGRIMQVSRHLSCEMNKLFYSHGLTASDFDVLATLRRSGQPYGLSPGELMKSTMVTSGTMTNRIDQLVKAKFVERITNSKDARSFIISLTNKGYLLIDSILIDHVKNQEKLIKSLTRKDKKVINLILKKFL